MHIVRDLLDKQLVDAKRRNMGRIDGLAMELRTGEQPLIGVLLAGGTVLTRRLPGFVGRWCTALVHRFGIRRGEPYAIPWSRVLGVERVVHVDIDSERSDAMASARRVRDHIVRRIPGASR